MNQMTRNRTGINEKENVVKMLKFYDLDMNGFSRGITFQLHYHQHQFREYAVCCCWPGGCVDKGSFVPISIGRID